MNDDNITFDDMQANRNNCNPVKCLRCVHADMLQVERSYSCVRCGCEKGRRLGTWAMGYPFAKLPFDACPDLAEVTDEGRKRMVNLAWEISCDRKRACSRPQGNHPVRIEDCRPQGRMPFPEVAASVTPFSEWRESSG